MDVVDDVRVVHEDEALLVLDKPSGLLAVPGRGPDKQDCLSARAQALCRRHWSCTGSTCRLRAWC